MLKIIPLLFLLFSYTMAAEVSATTQNIRSFPLPVENLSIKTDYNMINKNSAGKALNHGSIGDLRGFDLTLGYGLYPQVSLIYDFGFSNADYAGENLKNKKHDLFVKLNIYHNQTAFFETFSTDLGFTHNSANDLSITGSSLGISKMSDMSDNSFYMRFLTGSKFDSSILDFFLALKSTAIDTKIDTISYDRSEIALNTGFQYTIELGSYLVETGYEYIRLFKRDIKDANNNNHIINLTLSKILNDRFLVFLGTKYYTNQYNGIIPYLYNDKTKDELDQKFGYVTVGFVYNFDLKLQNH